MKVKYTNIYIIYIGASEEKRKFIDSEKVKITASERYETKFAGEKKSFIFGNWLFFKIWFFYFEIKGRPDSGFYILEFK